MKKLLILFTLLLAVPLGMLAQGGEAWNTPAQLPLGQEKSGQLSKDRTEEWWQFTVTEDGSANIYVAPGSGLRIGDVRLYYVSLNDNGTFNNYWQRSSTTYNFNPGWYAGSMDVKNLAPGIYLIKVVRSEGEGSYTVKCTYTACDFANDKVDDWNDPSMLPLETAKQGHLGYGYIQSSEDDTDWWAFEVTQDGKATIGITHEGTLRISDVRLYYYAYNDNGTFSNYWQRSSSTYNFNPGWYAGSMDIPNLAPGTYLIRVVRGEGQGGYELTYTFTPNGYDNDKADDDWNNAQTLPLNTPKQGHLGYGYVNSDEDNTDWWAFEVKQDGKANIGISHDGSLRIGDVRLYYYTYNDNGTFSNYWQRSSTTYYFNPGWYAGNMDVPNLAPGLYLIKVVRGEGQGGYELTTTFTPQEFKNDNEPNGDWDKGLANNYLARGQEKQAHLGYGYTGSDEDNYDYFRFTVPRDGKVNLIYTPTSANSWLRVGDIRLYYIQYDKDDNPVNYWQRSSATYWINPGWYGATLSIPNMAPGDYLVRVQRGEGYGAYTLKYEFIQNDLPNDAEPNGDWDKAAKLPIGKTLSGHLGYGYADSSEDNYDWYQIELPSKGDLKINIQPGSDLRIGDVRLYYYSYNDAGEPTNVYQRSQDTYYFNPSWYFGSMTVNNVDAGKYAIRVQRGEGQGNYRIAVNADITEVEPLEPLGDEKVDDGSGSGDGGGMCFTVWLSETEKHTYPLADKPMVTMADGIFTLTTMNTTVTYAHNDVLKYTLDQMGGNISIEDVYFIVWLSETEKHIYALTEKPMVTMADGKFTITTMTTTATYNHDQVMKFTLGLSDGTSGIELPAVESQPMMERHADHIVITGSKPNSPIFIYNVGGRLMARHKTDGSGNAVVEYADLPAGIYVVKTESITIKIAKR